jgi:hypothetical protein
MTKTSKALALAALALGGIAVAPASAQNPNFTPGDLVMGFQLRVAGGTGSDQTVLIRLPDTANFFRDTGGIQLNIVNIGALLDSTFGIGAGNALNWYENPELYFGLVGTWSSTAPSALQNLDPQQTMYISKSRTAVGTEGLASSTIANVASNTLMGTASGQIVALQQTLETGSVSGTLVKPVADANTWENFNAFSGANQSTAFGAFTGGIQQKFGAGSFGTFSYGAVEGALDLYRFQAANDINDGVNDQFGFGAPNRTGSYEATVTIDSTGNVSAILTPVPEPSAAILGGLGMLGLLGRRRRA